MFRSFYFFISIFTIFLIFSLCFFIPIFSDTYSVSIYSLNFNTSFFTIDNSSLAWPTPGFTTITSGFGYRNAPTVGARYISWRN